eukprot:CAMPEP_0172443160 /NCGR_PEP_ID=MMETSP1065-20121228/3466_1 /TAXON_ID=265537 /ORGANISM="Amphiprora paludosa, Strain CCMP125" /LENGTH=364 /DNA_ID=CAMNT_0013193289 /DNA_START=54 /DNA_END=1148 /DNA_ORIENTATION=+
MNKAMVSPTACFSTDIMEDTLDQLRTLLVRETRYEREDYIGCMFDGCKMQPKGDALSCDSAQSSSSISCSRGIVEENSPQRKTPTASTIKAVTPSTDAGKQIEREKLLFSEHHRARLCEWAIDVVNYYGFPLYSVEIAMNILDRYLAKYVPSQQRSMDCLHLLTLTSLYLALKLTTLQRPAPEIFVRLSRSKFTARQVEETELQIMQGLGWLVHPPTAEEFAQYYLSVLSTVYPEEVLQRMEENTLASIRSSLSDYVWVRFAPSVVAMGAISWSLHQLGLGSADCYPSPLAELHRYGIYVHQMDSMQALEYFYLRAMYSASKEQGEQLIQPSSMISSRKRPAPVGDRNTSPVSIIKDNPAVIED